MMRYWGYGGFGWVGMGLFMLLCLVATAALIGLVIYVLVRALRRDDAMSVLRRQLAEGKIPADEFERRAALLGKGK